MSRIHNQYRELENSYNYIDKTECLEKEIERFPSVYIEGAAGCGKTTMMRMFLEKHPEVDYTVLWMDEDEKDKEYEEYERYVDKYVDNSRWLILENVPEELPLHTVGMIKRSIRRLGGQDRIILIGRNEIPDALLGTFWNREMGLVTQNSMLFDQDEVECLIKQYGSRTSPEQLLRYTGGWAGIVDVILRLESKYGAWNPESCWHEMNRYIKEMILDTLQREEREILHLAQYLPWVDEEMCEEILGTAHAEVILGRMLRKGFLVHTEGEPDTRWSVAPIFCHIEEASLGRSRWMKIGKWYETHDHRAEQLQYDSLMPEVQLNLSFMRPQILTEQWVEELKPGAGRLLILPETKISCLCDIRDLSGLFACEKRRERQFARRWKECLDEDAWIFYRLARIEYYLETDRLSSVADEDMQLLIKAEELPSAFRLSALWLLIRIQRFAYDEERKERIERLETKLIHAENHARSGYAKAVASLNITAHGSQENLAKWLKSAAVPANAEVTEENIVWFYCRSKGYLLLNQYEKSRHLLEKMLPYLNAHRSLRIHAEVLFEKAVAEWNLEQHGQALKSVIESFLVNGKNRYVMFYTEYGVTGRKVLEAYIDWMKHNSPEGWHRKKKYNYGNVLHMPEADYLETILRKTRKEARHMQKNAEYQREERLTMTETVILQYLVQGLTNAQICQEMKLKLPTVKGHIYNIYKKMNVKNRVQAVMKWKEETE